ncbi:MAG: HDIG domain-containing protein [Peptoniphilaceae bacterium]|nr:HDIG domain-containing protein [Peptoniphilaceae bacterium]MDY6019714.1 HDIG domain-containing protein [Anaerococcus sp.]
MYKENFGNIPNRDKINYFLKEDNPNFGKWVKHSYLIGRSAKNIAEEIGLDPDIAYACGCLHDIGKYDKDKGARHIIKGFELLRSETFFFPARIALTHSFIIKKVDSYSGKMNIDYKDKKFIEDYLFQIEYNDYDKLIQLLDGSIKYKYLGIEERARINLEKYGDNGYYQIKIEKLKELEEYFEKKLKYPIANYAK